VVVDVLMKQYVARLRHERRAVCQHYRGSRLGGYDRSAQRRPW
jgi:hypothetical protein